MAVTGDVYCKIMGEDAPKWRERPPKGFDCDALICSVEVLLPKPGDADISTRQGYALSRMKTLARLPEACCPLDDGVRRALWLALGTLAFPEDAKRTKTRLQQASDAAINLTHGARGAEREALRRRCGGAARCIARLLSYTIEHIDKGV